MVAAQKGLAAWLDTTDNDPPTFRGAAGWAGTTRSLREEVITARWGTRLNEQNVPLAINHSKTMAIAVASGDEETGREDGFPCTRSPKGRATVDAVKENGRQEKFFFMIDPVAIEPSRASGRVTWILLIFRDMKERELRFELSRPTSIDKEGYVDEWAERIIFAPIKFDGDHPRLRGGDGSDGDNRQSPEIIVEIRKLG